MNRRNHAFLTPASIGGVQIKNRVIMLAMGKTQDNDDYTITEAQIAHFETAARGGVGLIIPGGFLIDREWPSKMIRQPQLWDDTCIPGLSRLTERVHAAGAKIFFQLWHGGQVQYWTTEHCKTVAELTEADMQDIRAKFAAAALRAKKSGADGVEIQACHNYLLCQFLSPLHNQRTDAYGCDTPENATRFTCEVIRDIKAVCGAQFPVMVKLNASDYAPGGITPEFSVAAAVRLEAGGADAISSSGGGALTSLTGMSGDAYYAEGWRVERAAELKAKLHIPVVATGCIVHYDYADRILRNGSCDFIGMGRQINADPEWVLKAETGREDELRCCIGCMWCLNHEPIHNGKAGCAVNPRSIHEIDISPLQCDGAGRKVVIVGAGPAGMQAALTLHERGFAPEIYEQSAFVGGSERIAAMPLGKHKLNWHIDWLRHMLNKYGIPLRMNVSLTADDVLAMQPYAVLCATGTTPLIPPIPGIDSSSVITVQELLPHWQDYTEHEDIVIAGAGHTGLETAASLGSIGNRVTVIDMLPEPDPATMGIEDAIKIPRAKEFGVTFRMSHRILRMTNHSLVAKNMLTDEDVEIPADRIVLCLGLKPAKGLYEALSGKLERVYQVGDAQEVDRITGAVQSGFDCARSL